MDESALQLGRDGMYEASWPEVLFLETQEGEDIPTLRIYIVVPICREEASSYTDSSPG